MIRHSFAPASFMDERITPILKKNGLKVTDSNNYRPIAIATTSSKIVEHAILAIFDKQLATGYWQYGYKKELGTEMAVFSLKQVISHYNYNNTNVYAAFLDASKAFDNVLHAKLCNKLLDRGIDRNVVRFFYFWCKNQNFVIKWGNSYSLPFKTQKSVRQGGVLSLVFFNIYTDNLGRQLKSLGLGCKIGNTSANCFFYADDICLLAPSIYSLQFLINECHLFALSHNLTFNAKKTVCMKFSVDNHDSSGPTVLLEGNIINWVSSFKYLGYTICNSVKNFDKCELEMRGNELQKRANMLNSKFSKAPNSIKKYLFDTYLGGIYCTALWTPVSTKDLNKVRVAYNDCLRLFFKFRRGDSVSDFCCNHAISSFNVMRRKLCFSLLNRVKLSNNILVLDNKNSMFCRQNAIVNAWFEVLYTEDHHIVDLLNFLYS